jgi:hypothetical protein
MGCSIELSEDRAYILLKVVGDFKGRDMLAYIVESHALGREEGVNRYLVDVTEARNVDSVTSNYEFAYSDMKKTEGIDPHARVAALVSPGDDSHDFVETVAHNANVPLKLFSDRGKALEYLLEE